MQNLITPSKTLPESSSYEYAEDKVSALLQGLSPERLSRYTKLAPHDRIKQLQLYVWNTALSESLYTPIQGLEIVTRNYFNNVLIKSFGNEWYDGSQPQFAYTQISSLSQAKESLQKEGKSITQNNLVSVLSFGFWTGLLGSKYETSLWRPCLYNAFVNKPKPFLRKDTHHEFDLIRILRNRIAHHEPILRSDLPNHYFRIMKMIGWFCNDTADWISSQTRFNAIWYQEMNPFL